MVAYLKAVMDMIRKTQNLDPPGIGFLELDINSDGECDMYSTFTLSNRKIMALGGSYDGWDIKGMEQNASLMPPPRSTILLLQ